MIGQLHLISSQTSVDKVEENSTTKPIRGLGPYNFQTFKAIMMQKILAKVCDTGVQRAELFS